MSRRFSPLLRFLAAGLMLVANAASGAELYESLDLRAAGHVAASRGKPVVLLFSIPDCQYCLVVRRNYLAPLTRAPQEAERLVVREVELNGDLPMTGFGGEKTSGSELARQYGVYVAPTVVVLDRAGKLLAPPLMGGDVAGMYSAYLDRTLDEAQAKLNAGEANQTQAQHRKQQGK
jgi:thioredoxin-related protein